MKFITPFIVAFFVFLFLVPRNTQPAQKSGSYNTLQKEKYSEADLKSDSTKKLPLIKVNGTRFVDEKGDTILLRGLAISDPDKIESQGHWSKTHFEKVKEMGAMIVRIPVHPSAWRSRTPQKYLKLLDQAVEWCTELDMYVIIDWHSIGNMLTGLYQNPMYNTSYEETTNFR